MNQSKINSNDGYQIPQTDQQNNDTINQLVSVIIKQSETLHELMTYHREAHQEILRLSRQNKNK